MFWTFKHKGRIYESWGAPRSLPEGSFSDVKPDYDVKIYAGENIKRNSKVVYMMQGDATLGMGDSIWLISYIRDFFRLKGNRHIEMHVCSSDIMNEFYSHFLPKPIVFRQEYVTKEEFYSFDHRLPAMYYWKDKHGGDKSWVDNKSIIEHVYNFCGMRYEGLPDFGEFTDEEVLYPSKKWYNKFGIEENDDYVFFQWHSSGCCKNIPIYQNVRIIKHLVDNYCKVYIIGRVPGLDKLEEIEGVKNLCEKTSGLDVFSLAFNSSFIVSPDSAGIHLGEAYRIPAVGILATLPPVYIASKYKIPSFMYGSGFCPHRPCGFVTEFPTDLCPDGQNVVSCSVLKEIDLDILDKCIEKTFDNRKRYRKSEAINFYNSMQLPISLKDDDS